MVEVRDKKLAATEAQRSSSLRRGRTLRLEGENDDHDEFPGIVTSTPDERSSRCCH